MEEQGNGQKRMRKRTRLLGLISFLIIISVANLVMGSGLFGGRRFDDDKFALFAEALEQIENNYVNGVEEKELIYGALRGMVESLGNPYSNFMGPDTYRHFQEQTKGEFGGLGIKIEMRDSVLTVAEVLPDTPAERAGVVAGDKIVKINGEWTVGISDEEAVKRLRAGVEPRLLQRMLGITLVEAVNKLRGVVGTEVTITIEREGEALPDFNIVRGRIPLESVPEEKVQMFEGNIGYVKLTAFTEDTARDLKEALIRLEQEGMKTLILDLRGNPGGLLDMAVQVTDKFLPKDKLIVYTEGRIKKANMKKFSRETPTHPNYPLIVLVNGASASASEIVAGAIQDWKRGLIIGSKTYGKASVQNVIPLSDGSAIRLTTARYFTPSGSSIDGKGILPDILVEEGELSGEEEKEQEGNNDKEKEEVWKSDPQLKEAVNLLKTFLVFQNNWSQ